MPNALLLLRALQGREADAAAAIEQAATGRPGVAIYAHWAAAILYNGLARYEEAAEAARQATSNTFDYHVSARALPELVEAAARAGNPGLARDALERLAGVTQPCGTDVALGVEARSRAMLSYGTAADGLYRTAIDHLGRTRLHPEVGRAHLVYGEWLRREGRRADAREQLRAAHDLFTAIGMEAFAERTGRELLATGEKVRKRSPDTRDQLTSQEDQIARLARDGLSNPEIGAQLFVSARTVEWHLRNVLLQARYHLALAAPDGAACGRPGRRQRLSSAPARELDAAPHGRGPGRHPGKPKEEPRGIYRGDAPQGEGRCRYTRNEPRARARPEEIRMFAKEPTS